MPSDLQVDNIKDGSATKTLATLSSSAVTLHNDVTFPTGHIIQTKFVAFDESQTIGNGSSGGTTFTNVGSGISGKEFSIDMSVASGNKVLGFVNVNIRGGGRYSALKAFYDSTQIAMGQTDGSRANVSVSGMSDDYTSGASNIIMYNSSFTFNYTPADANSHTYTIKAGNTYSATDITYINMPEDNSNANYIHRGYSHFMLMELQQ